jgi:hypothetical protein
MGAPPRCQAETDSERQAALLLERVATVFVRARDGGRVQQHEIDETLQRIIGAASFFIVDGRRRGRPARHKLADLVR